MTVKVSHKRIPASDLLVDLQLNSRKESYDLPTMKEQIVAIGRVTESVAVEPFDHEGKKKFRVLKGNRRTLAVQDLLTDPQLPSAIHAAIEKLECDVHEGLSDRERLEMVYDQGQQNQLTRSEIVMAVWRLNNNGWTEADITTRLYQALARFTGQMKKISEVQRISDPKEREKTIKKWLHGTVGNYLLAANEMGEQVRTQLYLTELSADRPLTDDEKATLKFRVSRTRINELNSAKQKDKKEPGWNPETGGPEFNAKIAAFITEDNSESNGPRETRMTVKDLERRSDAAKSPELRQFYQRVMGKAVEGFDFDAIDTEMYRRNKVQSTLIGALEKVKDKNLKELLVAIAYKGETETLKALEPFVS